MPKLIDTLTLEQLNDIINMYKNNISLREIEKRTSFTRRAVGKMLEELGIKTTQGNHYKKYSFNFDFFEKINSELSAYWLGFLYADGCILAPREYGEQEFKLVLNDKDLEILEKFKEDLQSSYPIRHDNSKINPQVIHCLRSQKAVNDLKALGCVENKSLILNFPNDSQVPQEFLHHFIRGYFDGDGSISSYQDNEKHRPQYHMSFVGTENFIKGLYNFLQIGSVFPDQRKNNSWYLHINGNRQIEKVYHILYSNATRYMQRKFLKFQDLLKLNESSGINV